jgi:7-cyano-7-deazaguanine synthase
MSRTPDTPAGNGRGCVLLLSGGLDSSTLLAHVRRMGWEVSALTFRYGQKHGFELEAAKRIAALHACRRHVFFNLPLSDVARSSLTSPSMPVPRAGSRKGIPDTYVPARNLVFLSVAVSWAESLGLRDVFIAVSSVDYSGYPDCRSGFIDAFEKAAGLGTKTGDAGEKISIHAPFLAMGKKDIIGLGLSLGLDYAMTHTCYDPDAEGRACGACDACRLRLRGFEEAGSTDPARYVKEV